VVGFCVSGVEPLCSAARELISKMDFREIGCEDGRWIELAQYRVQWWALVLAVLDLCIILLSSVSQYGVGSAARRFLLVPRMCGALPCHVVLFTSAPCSSYFRVSCM
jgi:hypothetical protein